MSNPDRSDENDWIPASECGLAHAAEMLGDKWILLILRELFYGIARFEDIREDLPIPKSVLSGRLTRLVALGIVEKKPYKPEGGRTRNSYHLSKAGWGLAKSFLALAEWGDQFRDRQTPVVAAHRETLRELRVKIVDAETLEPVRLRDVRMVSRDRACFKDGTTS